MGRVGRLNIIVLALLLIEIFGFGIVAGSSQGYRLEISFERFESMSDEILITGVFPMSGEPIQNPIKFHTNIGYINTTNIDCDLFIGGIAYNFGINGVNFSNVVLNSGQKNWNIECSDRINSSRTSTVSGSFDVFDFQLSDLDEFYFNDSIIFGRVEAQGEFELELRRGNNIQSINHNNGDYSIDSNFISVPGEYSLVAISDYYEEQIKISRNFSVGYANVKFEDTNLAIGESVTVELNIDSRGFAGFYEIEANGNSICVGSIMGETIKTYNFEPSNDEDYTLTITGQVNNKNYNFVGTNTLGVSEVEEDGDNDSPEVNLKYPAWEEIIVESTIEFNYEVEDNVDIEECKLKLYNASKNSVGIYETDELIFPLGTADSNLATENDLDKTDDIELKLVEFDEGDYIWEVECTDSAGNSGLDFNYFKVDFSGVATYNNENTATSSYIKEEEVNDLIDKINSFLEKLDDFGIEEKNALDILGIEDDMNFYKKQLIQMDQDMKFNLKFMTDDKRTKRTKEIEDEIDNIKDKIILDISVTDSYEYSKNSADILIEDIVSKYFELIGQSVKTSTLRNIVKYNEQLQSELSSRIETLELDIEYIDKTENIILVRKKLDIKTGSEGKLLEIIPSDISEDIVFVADAKDVGEGIWEVDLEKLKNYEVVYYFNGDFSLQKIEKSESILFDEEGSVDSNMITGFVVAIEDGLSFSFFSFFVGFLFLGYVGFFLFGKAKIEVWKKEPNVARILNLIKNTKLILQENDIETARANYHKMGELYKLLPRRCKMFFFNEIKMVRLAIDKKDVLNLVKEYEKAKAEFRKEDTVELYSKINDIYKKLPKKFQDKVYRRLVKNELK